jgi:hypothetical protein
MDARVREVALTLLREMTSVNLRNGHSYESDWCAALAEWLNRALSVSATATTGKANWYPESRQSIDLLTVRRRRKVVVGV